MAVSTLGNNEGTAPTTTGLLIDSTTELGQGVLPISGATSLSIIGASLTSISTDSSGTQLGTGPTPVYGSTSLSLLGSSLEGLEGSISPTTLESGPVPVYGASSLSIIGGTFNELDSNVSTVTLGDGPIPVYGSDSLSSMTSLYSDVTLEYHTHLFTDVTNFSTGVSLYETSHSDVVVDGDFTSEGLIKRGATFGTYSIVADNSTNWNTAYTHSQIVTGNPHDISWSDLSGVQPDPKLHASTHEVGGTDLINHDSLTGFVANEHIDWTSAIASISTLGSITGANIIGNTSVTTNLINELSAGAGVTIDGVILKDSKINWSFVSNTPTTLIGYGIIDSDLTDMSLYTTTDLAEGTRLYYTEVRVSANTDVAANTAFRTTPSTIITAGDNISWTGNTLNVAGFSDFGIDNQIPYTNLTGDGFDYSANFTFNGSTLDIIGNLTISGTVDGRDVLLDGTNQDALQTLTGVAAGSTNLGTFTGSIITDNNDIKGALQELESANHTRYALTEDLTSGEISQLQNINTVTITNTQWGYLGAMTSSPVVDGDFASQGLMKRGATSGSYSIIPDASIDWNTAFNHSQLTSGNPHQVAWTDLTGIRSGITLSGFNNDLVYVTSVGLSAPTGFSISGSPITTSGTLALAFATGYSLPTNTKQGQWDTAYGWGNHSLEGYLTSADLSGYAQLGVAQTFTAKQTFNSGSYDPLVLDRTTTNNVNILFKTDGTLRGYLGTNDSGDLKWGINANSASNPKIYHAGNSNLSTVDWASKNLVVNGIATISGPQPYLILNDTTPEPSPYLVANGGIFYINFDTPSTVGKVFSIDAAATAVFYGSVLAIDSPTSANIYLDRGNNTSYQGVITFRDAGINKWILGQRLTGGNTFSLYSYGTGKDVLSIDYSSGEVEVDNFKLNNIRLDESFDYDNAIYFTPQAYFEAESPTAPSGWTWIIDGFEKENNTDVPFSQVAKSSSYDQLYSDFIPVQAGETLYGEMWAMRDVGATGTAGNLYYGIQRYDKDKQPIASNSGTIYFVASAVTVPTTGVWTKYSGTHTLPTSHTPYLGSDGGPVRYVRVRILVNYSAGTIPTHWGGILLRRAAPFRDAGDVVYKGDLAINKVSPRLIFDEPTLSVASSLFDIGGIEFKGSDNSLNVAGNYASIEAYVVDANSLLQGSLNEGGRLDFNIWRHDISTDPRVKYTALTIDNYANVGIGTTSPDRLLHISSNTTEGLRISSSGGSPTMEWYDDVDNDWFQVLHHRSGDYLQVKSNSISDLLVISKLGNVGIGTTSPTATMHVKGNPSVALSGTVSVTNGSGFVNGDASTAFTTELSSGDSIKIGLGVYIIGSVLSNTALTLTTPYSGSTASGLTAYKYPDNLFVVDGVSNFEVTKDGLVNVGAAITLSDVLNFNDTNTQIYEDGSGNLTFKDAVLGVSKTLSQLSAGSSSVSITNQGDYKIVTSTSTSDLLQGESLLTWDGSKLGVGTTSPATPLEVSVTDANNNTVTEVLRVSHMTTGTAVSGIGAGIGFVTERASGSTVLAANIKGILTDVSAVDSALLFETRTAAGVMTEQMRITDTGRVGINTGGPPSTRLHVKETSSTAHGLRVEVTANSASYDVIQAYRNTTEIAHLDSTGDWYAGDIAFQSDPRLKNVEDTPVNGLDIALKLNPVFYKWKDGRNDFQHIGFLTTDVEKVRPELVKKGGEYDSLSYSRISAINTSAIQELYKEIQELKLEIKKLKNGTS